MKKISPKISNNNYKVYLHSPGYIIYEDVVILNFGRNSIEVSYRRKSSSLKDVEFIPLNEIIAIIMEKGESGQIIRCIPTTEVARNLKIYGKVSEFRNGFLKVINAEESEYYINSEYSKIIRPDELVNASRPKRGRKPSGQGSPPKIKKETKKLNLNKDKPKSLQQIAKDTPLDDNW